MPGTLETRVHPQCQKTKEPEKAHEVGQRLRNWGTHCALSLILALRSPQYLGTQSFSPVPQNWAPGKCQVSEEGGSSCPGLLCQGSGGGGPPSADFALTC